MDPVETESFKVLLNESHQIGILIWKREISLEECQQGLRELFYLLDEHELGKCLIDTNHRGELSSEAEEWEISLLQNDKLTFKAKELHIALLMSEEKYQKMIHDYSLDRVCKYNLPIKINYFTHNEEAMDWLIHEPPVNSK
ncbi:hypothetical protein [Rufibacter tibetensis]|uniref:STAS/SEC14 domain-containing protein n=1 Tax=Rufibacter tibetensis TaxID=512763 RepID=A0A0P0CUQ6_9BACT|nr:hypothetical protein [Rufibacter tibetensis]ALJ00374.1 hypothetical protein DC20_17100 [Rufibacter tibetensis]